MPTIRATTYLTRADAGYPERLSETPEPPALYVRGAIVGRDALAVAIVGARRASAYGLEVAERLASDLAARGVTIVSGLARGIDTAAHRGALAAGGRTIAVLGHGLDQVYPPENARLADEIAAQGAVVSQFAPGEPPLKGHFPLRNRTIAGLSLGVVVVEATERSGALITAGAAGDFGRQVFAIPGRITSDTSAGPHGLLRDGATLIRSWRDVVEDLPPPWRETVHDGEGVIEASGAGIGDTNDETSVLAALTADESHHIEDVIERSGLAPARVGVALMALELTGRVRQLEGQRWVAVGARMTRRPA
jgi:DNA processing protein